MKQVFVIFLNKTQCIIIRRDYDIEIHSFVFLFIQQIAAERTLIHQNREIDCDIENLIPHSPGLDLERLCFFVFVSFF